jgi:hypothetical protein
MARRALVFLAIVLFVTALGGTVAHHHEDGACHTDCAFCLFLIQPAVAGPAGNDVVCGLPASPGNLPASDSSLASFCFRGAPFGRAPPCHRG